MSEVNYKGKIMVSVAKAKEKLMQLKDSINESNAFEYELGLCDVSEKTIQEYHELSKRYTTALQVRGLYSIVEEIELAEMFMDYYNPEYSVLYYKEGISPEQKDNIKQTYKYWKGIRESLTEKFEETSKNVYLEV